MKKETTKAKNQKLALISSKIGKSDQVVIPVSNLPMSPDYAGGVPGPRDLENFRLKNRVRYLCHYAERLNDQISFQLGVLQEELRLWKLGLEEGEWPSLGKVYEIRRRLQSAIGYEGRMPPDKDLEATMEKVSEMKKNEKLRAIQVRFERVETNLDRFIPRFDKTAARCLKQGVKLPAYVDETVTLVGVEMGYLAKDLLAVLSEKASADTVEALRRMAERVQ